ncbi:MAG: hypothetical protein OXU23_13385 [Candidatus Poribacteria bacterium]|nr:hypothetical protein [Candidatus Poribacteria bacterium]MDE0483568.1 hypothetical protein [Candidatus Poribacteria bacterium]
MFVKTQFDTIVDVSKYDKIIIERHAKDDNNILHHVISAVSEKYHISSETTNGEPVITSKSATIAQFQESQEDRAQRAYDMLFQALLLGNTAFDMTQYAP